MIRPESDPQGGFHVKQGVHYVGLDVHKKIIAFCIRTINSQTMRQGVVNAEPKALRQWLDELPDPWMGAMEATPPVGSIYHGCPCYYPHNVHPKKGRVCLDTADSAEKPASRTHYALIRSKAA